MTSTIKEYLRIGDNLKHIRENSGENQTEFAKRLGISRSTYSNYENNNRVPDDKTLQKIADALGLSINDLLGTTPAKVIKSFDETLNYIKQEPEEPLIKNGKIVTDSLNSIIFKHVYEVYKDVYRRYGFREKCKMDELDFFYADIDFSKTLLSGVTSLIMGEIINTNAKIINEVNVKNNEKYFIPYVITSKNPLFKGTTTVLRHELGREDISIDFLKYKATDSIMQMIILQQFKDFKEPDEPSLNLSIEELSRLYETIDKIDYIENIELKDSNKEK